MEPVMAKINKETMKEVIAFDTETYLIEPGRLAPKLVCLSYHEQGQTRLLDAKDGIEWFTETLLNLEAKDQTLIGHNVSFDMGVMVQNCPELMPLVWEAYDSHRILDTMIADRLYHIEKGWYKIDPKTSRPPRFSLAACVERYFGEQISGKEGDDAWRLRYHELADIPLTEWPNEARKYALNDASYTWRIWQKIPKSPNLVAQCQSDWSLHLISAWGLRTDPVAVQALTHELEQTVTATVGELLEAGIYKQHKTGKQSKDMAVIRARVNEAYNGKAPTTPKGATSTAVATLEESGDPVLEKLAGISNDQKLLNTYIPVLQEGTKHPLNPHYYLVESGRTSSRKPNVQNQPRKGGVRECFIPREGYVYVACDYHVAELCALAQVLLHKFAKSKMADALNAGRDLHLETAAGILGQSYEKTVAAFKTGDKKVKETRQLAKAMNFGLPGGLGAKTFADYARTSYGVDIDENKAQQLKDRWIESYPEMRLYFDHISEAIGFEGHFTAQQLYSDRLRGQLGYCDGCNTYFQGLTADGARAAVTEVVRATLTPGDPLHGSRAVAFIHDEILIESPEDKAANAAHRLSCVMIAGMKPFLPDMIVKADAHIMRRWYKDAEPVFDDRGELQPWEPKST
jgi:DNA polymerase-1